ncbi:MAG: glycoside hydrolase family 13 protein [Streptococcaceae bacterium]|nr:glycoside hydrolase family 13 protein [Streptococcaceae bacterium]
MLNRSAVYHRPESEYAYVNDKGGATLRLRVGKGEAARVDLYFGDPYYYEKRQDSRKWFWKAESLQMSKLLTTEDFDYFECHVSMVTKRLDYLFVLTDLQGEKLIAADKGLFDFDQKLLSKTHFAFRLPFFHEVDRCKIPNWAAKTVWYQIFPERFANGDRSNDPKNCKTWNSLQSPLPEDRFGGDLQGVIDHLDHLTALGINGIYFTPIFRAPSNHKYDTENYYEIDPDFGDLSTFKNLVKEAHKRGMKIMLDAVFNHIGSNSPQWQDVLKHQQQSRYADWFHVNEWPARYVETDNYPLATYATFAYVPYMPKLNTSNPEVQEYLLSIAEYWIRECDIDAWRLDVADEVDHQFWKLFRKRCDALKKDFYIIGEVWQTAQSWLNGDEFSGVMNYATTLVLLEGLVKKQISPEEMISEINHQLMLYRRTTWPAMFNTLDSHDTARTLFECGEDKDLMKQVEVMNFLQPGAPCIFYGDEVGMTGGEEPDCRRPMVWDETQQDQNMFEFFQQLIHFRRSNSELLSSADLVWDFGAHFIKLCRGNLTAIFNIGNENLSFTAQNVLLTNSATDSIIMPKGFVIYNN